MLDTRTEIVPVVLPRADRRALVLVAGSGRSGTSLFAGIMQRLGCTVPQPEVPADETNPRGFAESQWVVDFHTRLLRRAGVQVADGRPEAWALTARAGLDAAVTDELRAWLETQFSGTDELIVKDPRLSWFLPLWRRCAADLGVEPRFATMLRHPAAVIDSKERWYGGWQGQVARAAGWLNQTLFTERATRDAPRVFIRYDDLLEDWTRAVGDAGEALDLDLVRRASPASMRRAHELVDKGLRRSRADWGRLTVPEPLRTHADEAWVLVSRLAGEDEGDRAEICGRLDELRGIYTDLFAEAEAIVHSSIAAAARARPLALPPRRPAPAMARMVVRRVPARYRRLVPVSVRRRTLRTLERVAG